MAHKNSETTSPDNDIARQNSSENSTEMATMTATRHVRWAEGAALRSDDEDETQSTTPQRLGVRWADNTGLPGESSPGKLSPFDSNSNFTSEGSIDIINMRNSNADLPLDSKKGPANLNKAKGRNLFDSNSSWSLGSRSMSTGSSMGSMGSLIRWDSWKGDGDDLKNDFATGSTLLGSMAEIDESESTLDSAARLLMSTSSRGDDEREMSSSLSRYETNLFTVHAEDVDSDNEEDVTPASDSDLLPGDDELQLSSLDVKAQRDADDENDEQEEEDEEKKQRARPEQALQNEDESESIDHLLFGEINEPPIVRSSLVSRKDRKQRAAPYHHDRHGEDSSCSSSRELHIFEASFADE